MSKHQIATKPGHRAAEHLFLMKSVMAVLEEKKEVFLFSSWDLKAFFDSESLEDVMRELYDKEIRGKLYRLIYKMNENIKIKVKTPVGVTDSADTGSGVGQGGVDAAVISSASIDGGVSKTFANASDVNLKKESSDKFPHNILNIFNPRDIFHPCIFQDDIGKLSPDVGSAQEANDRMEDIVERKLLTFNVKKSMYTVIGNQKKKKEMMKKLEENPLMLRGVTMSYSNSVKYLGDWVSSTCAESVSETVKKRISIASKSIFEMRSIVDDSRANSIGGLSLSFLMWELGCIPMLLNSAGTWIGMKRKTLKELEKLQLKHLRVSLAVGTGTPIPLLYSQTGTMTMQSRVMKMKLIMLHHVASLPENTLAHACYEAMVNHDLPVGLAAECAPLLNEFGISDIKKYTKIQFKRIIKKKMREYDKKMIVEMSKKYKKIDQSSFPEDDFCMKPYFKSLPVDSARWKFRIFSHMTPLAMNQKSRKKYRERGWLCLGCKGSPPPWGVQGQRDGDQDGDDGGLESDQHIFRCWAYADLAEGKLMSRDEDIISFYKQVLERRETFTE